MASVWKNGDRQWFLLHPGVEASDLHRHAHGGGAAIFRMRQGSKIPDHDHQHGEHTYVIEGSIRFGTRTLASGDAMWTEPGERHDVEALTDAVFMGVAPPK